MVAHTTILSFPPGKLSSFTGSSSSLPYSLFPHSYRQAFPKAISDISDSYIFCLTSNNAIRWFQSLFLNWCCQVELSFPPELWTCIRKGTIGVFTWIAHWQPGSHHTFPFSLSSQVWHSWLPHFCNHPPSQLFINDDHPPRHPSFVKPGKPLKCF